MFSSTRDDSGYDFNENAARWKGLFTPSLKKVLEQVHPRLSAKEDALLYVETLCVRVLALLCSKPLPHSVQDVEEKIVKTFTNPLDKWSLKEGNETISTKRKKLILPTDRVHTLLQKDVLMYKIDNSVSIFIVAVLEYISADVLKLAGNYVRKIKHTEITKEDIEVAMCSDEVLMDMFFDFKSNVAPSPLATLPVQRSSTTYEEVVKELIHDEKQYQRDLHMIIRVFREELMKIVDDPKALDPIFSNILDIYEVTVTLIGSLEDVIEMSQEQSIPCVGCCFEELAEAEEFDVYTKYAMEVTSQQSKDALTTLLAKPEAMSLMSAGHGFRDAVKFYLPKFLLVPIWHAFLYFDYIKQLMELSHSQEDIESFKEVQGLLTRMQYNLENIVSTLPKETCFPLSCRARRQQAIERTRELQQTVEHWEKDVGHICNEFIREGSLGKLGSGKRIADRKVYLFDGLMVLCKPNTKKQAPSGGQSSYDYRLKEKFLMRRVEINDRADTDELKNSFEISPRVQPPVILTAKSLTHKNDWMADLIMVNTKSMLDRILDSILLDIEKKHPLRMPSPDIYKFAVPDSSSNIILEERESAGVPLIKGATLCKLVERLTYHIYADPMFVRTFLTTYRYFCTPQNLLTLLIERFNIPDPSLVYQDHQQQGAEKDVHACDTDKIHKNSQREDWKRYRKEYVQPVQFRVLNVLRHWVDHHFYDFEKDPTLLQRLLNFLENVNGKSMRKWVDSVMKIVQRKNEQETSHKQITFAYGHSPPPIEHHLNVPDSEINLLTLHPLELARQLTLLEFELYKNVKPSELVGSPWTKKEKEIKSPNLLKIMKHTTNVTRWIEKSIIEAENYEERVAMVARAIEVMMVMLELNNFNGILSISAAMGSASVYRLKLTFQGLPARYEKFLEECRELNDGHLKKYQERLRSINPPCVPFFGRYLTNILHLEEGNPDFLHNTELINFSKRRKVSEIIGEIQQYQNQPYCLMIDSKIRNFLETLDPFKGMSDTDISNFLYHESLRIEPRGCKQPPKFPRKWASIPLKSPGIKPRRQNNSNTNTSGSGISLMQNTMTFVAKTQATPVGEHSPIASTSNSSVNANAQAFSVFANVNIPERNGSYWANNNSQPSATGHSKPEEHFESNFDVPQLPKKSAETSFTVDNKTPTHSIGFGVDTMFPQASTAPTADMGVVSSSNIGNIENDNENETSLSPLLKSLSQQRHEKHSTNKNRSPFQQSTVLSSKLSSHYGINFSPTETLTGGNSPNSTATSSPQIIESDFNASTLVPVSPHVNVPTAMNVLYRAAPPPLPPRRKERNESCAELAQKRQAPDAPILPPRDGELSPPPIPPRISHSINTIQRRQTNEFKSSSLLLPNTSSIMIRRNSAIEKKLAVSSLTNMVSAAGSTITTSSQVNVLTNNVPVHHVDHLTTISVQPSDEQSISPLSSSTTTSPMTPMTPISPHIPTDNAYPPRLKPSPATAPTMQQLQQFHHQHHHHFHQQKAHGSAAMGSRISSATTDLYSTTDSIPELPPKPNISRNCYKTSDKATMFLYPSTNQE